MIWGCDRTPPWSHRISKFAKMWVGKQKMPALLEREKQINMIAFFSIVWPTVYTFAYWYSKFSNIKVSVSKVITKTSQFLNGWLCLWNNIPTLFNAIEFVECLIEIKKGKLSNIARVRNWVSRFLKNNKITSFNLRLVLCKTQ